ncbi:MAG TPA: hypothetical protein VGP68_14545 [Gemmataceae bacterium]|nr:hypothetical protein [Gemmataceae bacterium]
MAKEHESEAAPDIKVLQRELAETKQLLNQLLAEKTAPQGQLQANIVIPDLERDRQERYHRRTEEMDALQAKAHTELMQGPRHFRICIFDELCLNKMESLRANMKPGNPAPFPQDCPLPPQNPWRIVGAHDEASAIAKYNKYFGIRSIAGNSQYMVYEVDEHGQALANVPVAA